MAGAVVVAVSSFSPPLVMDAGPLSCKFSLLSEWRSPLVRGGCVDLLVAAIAHATGPEAPPQEEACPILESAVAAIRQITKLEGAG